MSALPEGMADFLRTTAWDAAAIEPLPGDASFRRYFRLRQGADTAMLMHAPPPHEDPKPFVHVARWLTDRSLRAPQILAQDADAGWVLTEDFGNTRVKEWLDAHPERERETYRSAVDALVQLHRLEPGPFEPYDLATYRREVGLFTQWFCPAAKLRTDEAGWHEAWDAVLTPLLDRQTPGVTVLRDYHAENIMLPGDGSQGLIDFQDALVGHPAYDLVSLLQDARRDVSPRLEREMLDHYRSVASPDDDFEADYARLGAQRNAKIVGIFTRLARRDDKPRYLEMIPRVWHAMERDLAHEALAPVAAWFDRNVPDDLRRTGGRLPA